MASRKSRAARSGMDRARRSRPLSSQTLLLSGRARTAPVEFGLGRDPLLPLHPGTGTGGGIAAEEDRVEQPFVTIGGDTTKLVESLSFPSPGRTVEDSHRSLSVDLQTGHRRHPRGEARQVVRELGGPVPESCGVGARPGLGEFVGISPSSFAVGVGREDRLPVGAECQERNPVRGAPWVCRWACRSRGPRAAPSGPCNRSARSSHRG